MPAHVPESDVSAIPCPAEDPIERIILKSMNEGVLTLECTGVIHTVNPAALRILGMHEDETKGRHFSEVFGSTPEIQEFANMVREAMEEHQVSKRKETRFRRSDGQIIDLSVSSAFLEIDACEPDLQNVVVVFHDITPFKSLERVKRRALNHLSHELKTPLAISEASVRSLIDRELPRADSLKRLQRISRNLRRLTAIQSMVEEIFNPLQFKPEPLDAATLVQDLLDHIREEAAHRRVCLLSRVDISQTDRLDPFWVSAALRTLVKNAVESTPDGGDVLVSLEETPSGILMKVKDAGFGILMQDQQFVFEGLLYTQATQDYSSKKPYDFNAGGKGLELLRLKIASESGLFDIWFESQRCEHLPTDRNECPGDTDACPYIADIRQCAQAGGTTFYVLFT